ncbi:Hint domain-containing protein [Polynucleobacter asymbioticus]|jgi:hypothetical protein|uniref:Hedgehog/Intein (Hint) domain-containing protein n=1 Tax=Polynucleobacter asymbioticus TaxID=576611 RepID=A0AAC9IQC5_9BURK|nr:Hint domain-containing protein [Polynucleobacter asymbioticus]APB98608.1 hypothetical protein A4F89_04245 [Polynucleobacter asymbioticus]APC00894.1 hypothetical protein AOC25_04250 [Polynucleobacter asymbioticus]
MSFTPTTENFRYNFTDSISNVFDITITATNSIGNPNQYDASAISGTVNGVAVSGLTDFNGGDFSINLSGSNSYVSTTTGFSYFGMTFKTATSPVETFWTINYDEGNLTYYTDGSNYGYGTVPDSFQVVPTPTCFTPDTLISTPAGSTPVQDLQIGDLILNHLGQAVPVKWIGTQRFHPAFAGDNLPICIRQGALGNDLPLRDLYVSPGHALYIDHCLLIDAKALVNGTTITQVTQWEGDVQYLHIETEHHEIILAEGAPAETFMDNVSRTCFNNYSEYQALYPEEHEMIELDIPRVSHQRQLPNAVKAKLEAISEVLMGEGHGVKRGWWGKVPSKDAFIAYLSTRSRDIFCQ